MFQGGLSRHVLVQDGKHDDWQHCMHDIEELIHQVVVELLSRESSDRAEEVLGQHHDHVLVERVVHKDGNAAVAPTTVHQQQALQESELRNAIVGDIEGLQTLQPLNANAHVGALDHVTVIRAVADGQRDTLLVLLDEADDGALLLGRDAAGDDRPADPGNLDKALLVLWFQCGLQALSVNDQPLKHLTLLFQLLGPVAHFL
mmetsp:Transcript_44935/g.101055  ORF Transcript_44935/g.101055 Transcript_44935/m.101055 type:complete len:202 (+) Transcript_44935:609-1214(+)